MFEVRVERHDSSSCTTNLEKLKCFKCGQLGHASLNCRVKKSPDGKPFPSKGSGKSLKRVKRVVVHLERDLRGLARAKRVKCLQSWMRMVVGGTRSVLLKKKRVLG